MTAGIAVREHQVAAVLLHLLRGAVRASVDCDSIASVLHQHHVGGDEEGGRAVELLRGGAEDPEAVLVCADAVYVHHRGDGDLVDEFGAGGVAGYWRGVGCDSSVGVSFNSLSAQDRRLIDSNSLSVACHVLYPVR